MSLVPEHPIFVREPLLQRVGAVAETLTHYLNARRRFTHLHGEALRHFQDTRARQAVEAAISHSAYYRERFADCNLSEWSTLPTTDKRAMMADFGRFNTRGISGEAALETALRAEQERDFRPLVPGTNLTVGLSSGTSGHRGVFLVAPKERHAWAGTLLARALPGPLFRPGGWRIAFIHRSGSNLYQSLGGAMVRFRFLDLMTPLADIVAALNAFAPHILTAPPTLLGMLAQERQAGNLTIRPERLLSVAEVLEPQDAEIIAAAFDLPAVDQIYQSTEGLLAVSCLHHRLHWQEDIVAAQFEPLESEEGTTRVTPILTDLWRTTQPIIRYRLGDALTLAPAGACPCGSSFQIVERIEGRCDDICYFPQEDAPSTLRPFFPDTLRRAILLASPQIADYRVIQEKPGELTVYLSVPAGSEQFATVADAARESLRATVARYGCRLMSVAFYDGLPAAEGVWKKRRRVVRLSQD